MTKQELKKKRKQIVESKGYKEWEPQQEKLIAKRKEAQKNAEIQRRKVELSNKKDNGNAFTRNTEAKQYFKPTPANITTDNVNRRFQELMLEETKQEKEIEPQNKLFQNLNVSLSENKSNLANQKRADAKLTQEELDKLASMDRKGRVEALKGRGEKTLQEAELYALAKRNEETEKKVNEAKGVNKFLAANEYLAKEFAENTVSSFGQIKATADRIQGRDKDISGLEYAQKYQEAISPLGQNVNSRFLQNLGIAAEGVGQQTPQILLGASGAGALVGGFTEFANTYNEMTLENPNNKTKTMITALLKGTVAGGLESALGLFGGGKLDKLSKSQLAGIKNKLVRNVMATGYDVAGEITEEQLENMIGYVIDKAVNDKDITMEQAIQEAEATFKQTGLTTILMSALGLGGNTRREVNSIAERTNWLNQLNVTSPQKTELRRLAQDENITNEELYNQVMKIEQENAYQDTVYENVIKKAETTKKQQATIENKEVLNQSQQTTLKQGEMPQKQASSQPLGNEKYTIKMPNSNYKFEKTGNINEDTLDESMSKYFNNSKDTQKLNATLKKIMNDKNLSIKFDDTITDEAGNIIDGKYENGSITINPNSSKAFEYVATHELTHAIGTDEMLKMVDNYRKSNSEFNEKVETLLKNYDKSELTEEALADVSAELFGTQEFIVNVKNTNPNLFQKIYNEIKYLWHQFRGYKNQNQFVEDLYNKWTQAYNSKEELNKTSKYLSVEKNNDLQYNNDNNLNSEVILNDDNKINREISSNKDRLQEEKYGSKDINEDRGYNSIKGSGQIRTSNNGLIGGENNRKGIKPISGQSSNEKQLIDVDTEGNKVSENMRNFMKDSAIKVNDKLLNVYHGTDADFTVFDSDYIGSNSGDVGFFGDGFYFATHKGESKTYGEKAMPLYLNIKKPFYFGSLQYLDGKQIKTYNNTTMLQISNLVKQFPELKNKEIAFSNGNTLGDYGEIFDRVFNNADVKKFKAEDYNGNEQIHYIVGFEGFEKEYDATLDYTETDVKFDFIKDYLDELNMPPIRKITDVIQDLYETKVESSDGIAGGFSKILKKYGYDGIVVADKVEDADEIIAFYPEQIKSITNQNPTDNPDIRYSKQNAEWYDYVQDTFKTEGTRTTKDQITKDSDSETITEEEYTPTQKAINYEQRQKNNFKRNMSDMLGISQYNKNNKSIFNDAIDEMQKEYNATGTISQETKDRVFENMYNGLIKEDAAFYNENKEIKNEIRNTTLYVSDETKADITDYADFKRSVFGNVRLSNNKTDMPIDTFYKELSSQRPDLFPESIITTSEQLKRIAEVSKSIRKSERNLAAYNNNMEAAEYKKWAKNEFEIQTARLQEQFAFVNKYNESKQSEFEKKNIPYSRPDVAEIKSIYQNRNEIRKEVEKQERNLLLTDREKAIVNRLLNDEMDVSEIMPGYNKEGIIKSYYARQQLDYLDKEIKRYKQDKKQELYDMSENLISGIKDWKDKKIGLQYSRETAQRNIRDIMSKQEAERINRELFDPIQENTANQIRFINDYNKQIEELELDKKAKYEWKDSEGKEIKIDEATLAQLLIEKKIDENYLTQVGADVEKIKNAANTFSRILNEVVDMMDDVYVEFGYAPVERRKNYFPHFIENKPDTLFSKIANALNFSTDVAELPTDIAGRTESFKPGRAFNRNILKRTTEKTDYNALKAIDMYLQGASDIIYHTADIQKLRAFQEAIRDNYRDVEIQKKILEIEENTEMTADERAEKIKEIKKNIKTPLPKLVGWLDEYTDLLANKKSSGDRQTEKDLNRKMYTTMQEIEGKIASNLIGGNLSVSLTNVAPLFQAMGTTELGNIFVGMVQTAQNDIKTFNNKGDNFADASDFLTSRRGNELLQKQTVKQNISNVAGIPMQVIDNFVSESIVRAKYRENIKKGMDNDTALKAADTYARNLMADRSKGALPVIFARKNPFSKLMTSFQVEPNNIISNYFKDMKADAETKTQLAYQAVKLSAASFVFNEVLKSIRGGSDVIPNPIGIASRLIALAIANNNDDEEDDLDEMEVLKEIGADLLGSIPFGTTVANTLSVLGVEGFEDTGKFMTSNAIPSAGKLIGLVGEDISPEYRKQTLIEELSNPLIYLGLPTAGSQISKTAKGLKAFVEGGSYKYNKKGERQLQFPVEQNATNAVKSTVFGKYSLPGGTKYIDEGFKSLNGKETMVYEQSSVDFDELKTYFEYSKKDGVKKKDQINYVENMDISLSDKWNLYKHNIISNKERDDGTSQLSDAEFVINNNMATPEEYMKMYSKAEKNEVEFPGTETLQELKDTGLSLKTYMDYKTKLTLGNRKKKAEYEAQNNMPLSKEESEKRKSLNTEEKIALLEKYSDREKSLIYENYIGKSDTVYQHLKQLTGDNVRINDYLDYKIADLESDRKNDGTKKGKSVKGSAEKKLLNFLNNSKFSNIERIYIYGQTYELNNSQRQQFQNYIRKLDLTYNEEKEIWLDLSSNNVVEMKDGSVRWK